MLSRRIELGLLGAIFALYGLPGVISDTDSWLGWTQSGSGHYVLFIAGLFLLTWAALPDAVRDKAVLPRYRKKRIRLKLADLIEELDNVKTFLDEDLEIAENFHVAMAIRDMVGVCRKVDDFLKNEVPVERVFFRSKEAGGAKADKKGTRDVLERRRRELEEILKRV